ncbi:hypothetical protein BDV40DRAFT_58596 [Aspergillus tamarii]|uniref:Uncharacterized protein n=1 Tax=Aspergillus tamarii TaxID=41984 RepID=A0A5N6V3S3_ASPTM|nr:hypothetical protein BDV40DRAFT_58596 [Aspergillus tamarii]
MAESTGDSAPCAVSTCQNSLNHAKCVILRLRGGDFLPNFCLEDLDDAIRAYLVSSGRSVHELKQIIHSVYQEHSLVLGLFYIIIDLHKDQLRNSELNDVQHELHRIRRAEDGTMYGC